MSDNELVIADRYGREMPQSQHYRKEKPPKLGEKFGLWAGRDPLLFARMPGGAMLQFDLDKLTLADYRAMRQHPSIHAPLMVLTFMLHQAEWHIECEDQKIAEFIEGNVREIWTRLIRGLSTAFWAGYAPCVLEYENNVDDRKVEVNKVKDLVPEECRVNWKEIEGWSSAGHVNPKLYLYDGISQFGLIDPIPPEVTLWYPLLMEGGDYYGKKMLKTAFPSWFFSMIIHLFANRYYERFGEPLPIGRADFEDSVPVSSTETITGKEAMERMLQGIRSRAVAVLPSDRDPDTKEYNYDIEFLESQMRGADFERYLARLDEEMSMALFTPLLLLRTGESGAYNLGVQHLQTYLWCLNALAGDLKEYIDRFLIERLKAFNFSSKAPKAQWVPHKMGKENQETVRAIIQELLKQNKAKVDVEELGQALGLTVEEVTALERADEAKQMAEATVDSTVAIEGAKTEGKIKVNSAKPKDDPRVARNKNKSKAKQRPSGGGP